MGLTILNGSENKIYTCRWEKVVTDFSKCQKEVPRKANTIKKMQLRHFFEYSELYSNITLIKIVSRHLQMLISPSDAYITKIVRTKTPVSRFGHKFFDTTCKIFIVKYYQHIIRKQKM